MGGPAERDLDHIRASSEGGLEVNFYVHSYRRLIM